MNKEDINYLREKLEKENKEKLIEDVILTTKTYANALNKITNLQEENERLSVELNNCMIERNNYLDKLDKAIEYIQHYGNLYCLKDTQFKKYAQYKELLDILGGN